MKNNDDKKLDQVMKWRYFLAVIILWTVILGVSLTWNIYNARQNTLKAARNEASTVFERNIIFRRWSAMHGGVYVVVGTGVTPNPYLAGIPERDVLTPSGRTLTLLNPASIMRQTYELAEKESGVRQRLVSLNPMNPDNLPNLWERSALMAFNKGELEINVIDRMKDAEYMRLMRPVKAELSCLSCHTSWKAQGKSIQAGLSVSVPMAPFRASYSNHVFKLYLVHIALWLVGFLGVLVAAKVLHQSEKKRKVIEGALRESEEHFSTVFKESPVGMFIVDMDYKLVDVNEVLCTTLGYSKDDFTISTLINCIWPKGARGDARRIFGEMFSENRPFYRVEKNCVQSDGQRFWVALTASILHDNQGKPLYGLGMVEDISERKEVEAGLRRTRADLELRVSKRTRELTKVNDALRSEITERQVVEDELRLFKRLINGSNDCIAVIDPESGGYLEVNDKLCESLGYSREELLTMNIIEVSSLVPNSEVWKRDEHLLRETGVWRREGEFKRSDGSSFPVDINVKLISQGDKDYIVSIARDITERRQEELEREEIKMQLQRSQKMEAVGRLAGGIAHDFNNIQSAIKTMASLGMRSLDSSSPAYGHFKKIDEATKRASNLTSQLLTFSRHEKKDFVNIDICKVTTEVLDLIRPLIGRDIEIDLDTGSAPMVVKADKGNVEQVVTNLVLNAKDAMHGSGKITIDLEKVSFSDESSVGVSNGRAGDFVCLKVEDSGHGIAPADMRHIFEPFYSTKDRDKGVGLGLAVVYGIVKDHFGFIDLSSRPGDTIFSIYLPISQGPVAEEIKEDVVREISSHNGAKIMLVEDDQLVRDSTAMILRTEGYDVVTAKDSKEAKELYANEGANIDMVISDCMIPGKPGHELLEELAAMDGHFRGLLYSGYMEKDVKSLLINNRAVRFIKKPYEVDEFLMVIGEILSEP
ncbi:diguanylate cyclase/phosphodiesterase (GGDEF & EAL domains) with PAS/PAC sensor(s) [hydrothermal vent metagenome]|uniref:histidine kinase n=1 Tax=hydrothermal vent metagenome TaxID=652676 RepID=A0A3B0R599_9ZZZZ